MKRILVVLAILLTTLPHLASATSPGPLFIYEGVLSDSSGQPLASTQFIQLQILYAGTCVLFEENHPNISLGPSGEFKLIVGSGQRTDTTNNNAYDILTASGNVQCAGSPMTTTNISNTNERTLRIKVGSATLSPDMEIAHVPFAMNTQRIENKMASDLLQTSTQLTQNRLENFITTIIAASGNAIKWNGTSFSAFNPHDGARFSSGTIAASIIQDLPYSKITSTPPSLVQIGGLTCLEGKILKHDGVAWTCADETTIMTEQDPTVQSYAQQAPNKGLQVIGTQLQLKFGNSAESVIEGNDTRLINAFAKTVNLNGDVNGTILAPEVAKIRGNTINTAILSGSENGQVYRWKGNEFKSEFLNFGDLRTFTGTFQLNANCTLNQKIQWSFLTDSFQCESIGTLDGSSITTGTFTSTRLPAAAENTDGLVNQVAQKFSGLKTFLNEVMMSGTLKIVGSLKANALKLGHTNAACNASTEGSFRYNSSTKAFEGCNGSEWSSLYTDTENIITLSPPSHSITKSGPVQFVVTYGDMVDENTINLENKITLAGVDATDCVASVTGAAKKRIVTINNCTGTGILNITIEEASAAMLLSSEPVPKVGPSLNFSVDSSAPTTPSDLQLGSNPISLNRTPTISYTGSVDVGSNQVAGYQVQIVNKPDGNIILDWTAHINGSPILNLNLIKGTEYAINVRAFDVLGNTSPAVQSLHWMATDEPCDLSPTPGTLCKNKTIFLGTLSPGATSGSGTDRYMTTPGGCDEIPSDKKVYTGYGAQYDYPNGDFTLHCSGGMDFLTKSWMGSPYYYDGYGYYYNDYYNIPSLTDTYYNTGTVYGDLNTDQLYGDQNTTIIASITASYQGGYHAAARYCDKLVYGGYSDWYLPNRYELNLFFKNKSTIPGLDTTGSYYWSSTEYSEYYSWSQSFNDGNQNISTKPNANKVRCVRRF